ncbi:MAG: hypothetical protein OJF51_001729 [Nitrospira sp.]|nr:MAG: hypothetical protein OJF51_001729 [Nitrospira sp.]
MRHAYSRSYNLVPIGLSLSWTSTSMSLTYKEPHICGRAPSASPRGERAGERPVSYG